MKHPRPRAPHPLVKQIGPLVSERFVLGEVLGGGSGLRSRSVVVACDDRKTGRHLAMKLFASRDRVSARAHRGAEANVGRVNHPNVCSAVDIGEQNAVPFVVLERLHGETLAEHLKRSGPLAIDAAIDIFTQVLSALEATHAARVIHRNLNPSNIFLVHRDGCAPVVKIIDFGVSRRGDDPDPTKRIGGEFVYMSPEESHGKRVDERSDIYSVGVSFFEAVSGRRPYTRSYDPTLHRTVEVGAPDVRTVRPETPAGVAHVIRSAAAFDREHRFPSAHEMLGALKALQVITGTEWDIPTVARAVGSHEEASMESAMLGEERGRPESLTRVAVSKAPALNKLGKPRTRVETRSSITARLSEVTIRIQE